MEFLWSTLSLGGLYTDTNDDADADDTDADANDNDNTTRQTENDCIGSLPNEPKSSTIQWSQNHHRSTPAGNYIMAAHISRH